jgi:polar amino acid transport system substrate-binding protein
MLKFKTIILFFFLSIQNSHAAQELTIGQIQDDSYECSDKLLVKAYKSIGINIKFIKFPAERSLVEANSGKTDGEIYRKGSGIEENYKNLIKINVPIKWATFVALSKGPLTDLSDEALSKKCISFQIGIKALEERYVNFENKKTAPMNEDLMNGILNGSCDVFINTLESIQQIISQNKSKYGSLTINRTVIFKIPLFHYLNSKNKNLVPQITKALKELESKGLSKKILKNCQE